MKTINHSFEWTDKTSWSWPDQDATRRLPNSLLGDIRSVENIDRILKHCRGRNTCVQAGAAAGIWPFRLSQEFDLVISAEPFAPNFEAASENLHDIANIRLFNAAFGTGEEGGVSVRMGEAANTGACYVDPEGDDVPSLSIDSLISQEQVDLIALDVEGYEMHVLDGARSTIERCRPVIVVEDKHARRYGIQNMISAITMSLDYHIAEEFKHDVILCPNMEPDVD